MPCLVVNGKSRLTLACVVPVAMIVRSIVNSSPFCQQSIAGKSVAFKVALFIGEGIWVLLFAKMLAVPGVYLLFHW